MNNKTNINTKSNAVVQVVATVRLTNWQDEDPVEAGTNVRIRLEVVCLVCLFFRVVYCCILFVCIVLIAII